MKTKLEELVKDRQDLVNVIFRLRTDHRARRVNLTSRRMLVAMYASLAINPSIFEVVGLKSISSMNWKGDKNAEEFFTEFQKRYTPEALYDDATYGRRAYRQSGERPTPS